MVEVFSDVGTSMGGGGAGNRGNAAVSSGDFGEAGGGAG